LILILFVFLLCVWYLVFLFDYLMAIKESRPHYGMHTLDAMYAAVLRRACSCIRSGVVVLG